MLLNFSVMFTVAHMLQNLNSEFYHHGLYDFYFIKTYSQLTEIDVIYSYVLV
jgi:hypothetical protein